MALPINQIRDYDPVHALALWEAHAKNDAGSGKYGAKTSVQPDDGSCVMTDVLVERGAPRPVVDGGSAEWLPAVPGRSPG